MIRTWLVILCGLTFVLCSCVIDSPAGTIDLSKLPTTTLTLNMEFSTYVTDHKFVFHWCTMGSSPPAGIKTACGNSYIEMYPAYLGDVSCEAAFSTWRTGLSLTPNGVLFSVTEAGRDSSWTAEVKVLCNPNLGVGQVIADAAPFKAGGSYTNLVLNPILYSSAACPVPGGGGAAGDVTDPNALTGGGIFLIVFFLTSFFYVAGGVAINRYRGVGQGIDLLPNLEFWKSVPSLVSDGCVFTYTEIKEKLTK